MTKRIDCIKSSAIRKVFEKAAKLKNVVNLSIGQPDFPVPQKLKESMINAINENKTGYTPSAGIHELQNKLLEKNPWAESVIVTSGVSGGIFLSFSTLLEEGDELIIFDPYFVMYPDLCSFLNAKPVIVKTKKDYSIDFDALEKAITLKAKAILVNSPNNPSGHVCEKDEIEKLIAVAKKHDLWIISDEVYESFDYDYKFTSLGPLYPKSIVLNGFSKNLAMTGLRIGYALGPKKIIDDMVRLQQYSFVCAPSISQHAVIENLDIDISEQVDKFKKRRDLIYDKLKDHFDIVESEGAFYYYIKLPDGITGEEFSEKCIQKSLLVVPGFAFSKQDDHIRISYAASDEDLRKGIDILIEVKNSL